MDRYLTFGLDERGGGRGGDIRDVGNIKKKEKGRI